MKKQTRLEWFTLVLVVISLLIPACSTNSAVSIEATATPTAVSGSSQNNIISTPAVEVVPSAIPAVKNVDICSFFTSADAEPLVGTAVINLIPGNDFDEITGGPLEFCTYKGDDVALVLSLVKSSAAHGSQDWQNQLLEMTKASDPNAVVTPAADIGEQAYWVITEESVGLLVAKYPHIFILGVGGNIGYADDYKDDLTTLAQKVMDQLP
jgi:hypothetical protein